MTDDLVQRLRDPETTCCEADIRHEAADRIEALKVALRDIADRHVHQLDCGCYETVHRALEVK